MSRWRSQASLSWRLSWKCWLQNLRVIVSSSQRMALPERKITYSTTSLFTSKPLMIWKASHDLKLAASFLLTASGGILSSSSTCDRGKLNARWSAISEQTEQRPWGALPNNYGGDGEVMSIGAISINVHQCPDTGCKVTWQEGVSHQPAVSRRRRQLVAEGGFQEETAPHLYTRFKLMAWMGVVGSGSGFQGLFN